MKNIIIGKNNMQKLTFEEVHEKWEGLIKKSITSWVDQYEFDELYQTASIALWRTYEKYDAEKLVGFGHFAKTYIERDLLRFNQKHQIKFDRKTSQIKSISSLNEIIYSGDYGEIELQDALGEDEVFTDQVADKIVIEKMLRMCTPKQKKCIDLYFSGYSFKEVGKHWGVTGQAIQNNVNNAFNRIREVYAN